MIRRRPGVGAALVALLVIIVPPAASAARVALPNPHLTPGAVVTADRDTVCTTGYAHEHRNVTYRVRDRVYRAYGIPRGSRAASPRRAYVIDHLVPLELGGANDARNLWPQPRAQAKQKDRVEDSLHEAVCSGRMPLAEAQRIFESGAWSQYVR